MKLYVWQGEGVLQDYTSGMICVLADSLEEALKLIEQKSPYAMNNFPVNEYEVVEKPEAFMCWGGS